MFGFIWATIVGIGAIVSGSKLAAQNNNSMNRAEVRIVVEATLND